MAILSVILCNLPISISPVCNPIALPIVHSDTSRAAPKMHSMVPLNLGRCKRASAGERAGRSRRPIGAPLPSGFVAASREGRSPFGAPGVANRARQTGRNAWGPPHWSAVDADLSASPGPGGPFSRRRLRRPQQRTVHWSRWDRGRAVPLRVHFSPQSSSSTWAWRASTWPNVHFGSARSTCNTQNLPNLYISNWE